MKIVPKETSTGPGSGVASNETARTDEAETRRICEKGHATFVRAGESCAAHPNVAIHSNPGCEITTEVAVRGMRRYSSTAVWTREGLPPRAHSNQERDPSRTGHRARSAHPWFKGCGSWGLEHSARARALHSPVQVPLAIRRAHAGWVQTSGAKRHGKRAVHFWDWDFRLCLARCASTRSSSRQTSEQGVGDWGCDWDANVTAASIAAQHSGEEAWRATHAGLSASCAWSMHASGTNSVEAFVTAAHPAIPSTPATIPVAIRIWSGGRDGGHNNLFAMWRQGSGNEEYDPAQAGSWGYHTPYPATPPAQQQEHYQWYQQQQQQEYQHQNPQPQNAYERRQYQNQNQNPPHQQQEYYHHQYPQPSQQPVYQRGQDGHLYAYNPATGGWDPVAPYVPEPTPPPPPPQQVLHVVADKMRQIMQSVADNDAARAALARQRERDHDRDRDHHQKPERKVLTYETRARDLPVPPPKREKPAVVVSSSSPQLPVPRPKKESTKPPAPAYPPPNVTTTTTTEVEAVPEVLVSVPTLIETIFTELPGGPAPIPVPAVEEEAVVVETPVQVPVAAETEETPAPVPVPTEEREKDAKKEAKQQRRDARMAMRLAQDESAAAAQMARPRRAAAAAAAGKIKECAMKLRHERLHLAPPEGWETEAEPPQHLSTTKKVQAHSQEEDEI